MKSRKRDQKAAKKAQLKLDAKTKNNKNLFNDNWKWIKQKNKFN